MVDIENLRTKWSAYSHPKLKLFEYNPVCNVLKYLFTTKTNLDEIDTKGAILSNIYAPSIVGIQNAISENSICLSIFEEVGTDGIESFKKRCKENYCKEGWEFLDTSAMPMAHYIQQKNPANAIVMRNIEKQQAVIIVPNSFNNDYWTRMVAVIDKLLPWFFDLSDDKNFLKLLDKIADKHNANDIAKLENIMNEAFDKLNLREQMIKCNFDGFENALKNRLIGNLEQKILNTRDYIRRQSDELNGLYSQLAELNFKVQSYLAVDDSGNNFVNFILSHKNIDEIKKINDSAFVFTIRETIEYYDEEGFKTSYNTPGSFFYKENECSDLFYELFINHRGKIETVSEFRCSNLTELYPVRQSDSYLGKEVYSQAVPHPHLANFACLGGNQSQIGKYLGQGDWDMAIEQAIGATKNINISDISPMSEMIRYVKNHKNEAFIIADNGKRMTVTQFTKYIKGDKEDVKED